MPCVAPFFIYLNVRQANIQNNIPMIDDELLCVWKQLKDDFFWIVDSRVFDSWDQAIGCIRVQIFQSGCYICYILSRRAERKFVFERYLMPYDGLAERHFAG
jgi:hypothetical protein